MKEEARIQIRGDKAAFQSAWNSRSSPKIEYGLVVIFKDDPAYGQMRQLFDRFASEHAMTWYERVHVEYTQQELDSFDVLRLIIVGRAGPGNNAYAPVYEVEPVCSACGRVAYHQVRNLAVDFSSEELDSQETGYFQHDLCKTDFEDILVSDKVRTLLETERVSGVTLRPIDAVPGANGGSNQYYHPYYQMLVDREIGLLVEPSRVARVDLCSACGQYKEVLVDAMPGSKEGEFYFARSGYDGVWLMRTTDVFGRGPRYAPEQIISREFYKLLCNGRVTGFWVEPAHLT